MMTVTSRPSETPQFPVRAPFPVITISDPASLACACHSLPAPREFRQEQFGEQFGA